MDLFEEEIVSFFTCLNEEKVRYILVGGMAVNYHGFSRSTGDIDIWLDDSEQNRDRFVKALSRYGVTGSDVFMSAPFVAGYTEVMLDNGIHIDLMSDLQFFKKENFNDCFQKAEAFFLTENLEMKVLHLNTLIEEKERSSRPKDAMDAETLKKLHRQ